MLTDPHDLQISNWTLKVRPPEKGEAPQPAIFLIHGWTGDERSMWVFAPRLPRGAWFIAPRAPYISKHPDYGGYSWVADRVGDFSNFAAFAPARTAFNQLLDDLAVELEIELSTFAMAGFSQGAAFCYTYALSHPERVSRLAGLAGFLPDGGQDLASPNPLAGKPILIAHGAQDETVPIARARAARDGLTAAGANVKFCQSDTGHKLGANCARELQAFFT